jgi:DNA-binding IscR family transcriptional regulator
MGRTNPDRLTIPQVRKRIEQIVDELGTLARRADEIAMIVRTLEAQLHHLRHQLVRQPSTPRKRAPRSSSPIDDAVIRSVKYLARHHPDMSQAEIAARHKINPGRVSEILGGKR